MKAMLYPYPRGFSPVLLPLPRFLDVVFPPRVRVVLSLGPAEVYLSFGFLPMLDKAPLTRQRTSLTLGPLTRVFFSPLPTEL